MNIQQAQTDLAALGTLAYCDVSGEIDQNFLIAITDFTYSNASVMAIMTTIETNIKDVYPVVDHLNYDISARTAKIQLSKATVI